MDPSSSSSNSSGSSNISMLAEEGSRAVGAASDVGAWMHGCVWSSWRQQQQ